MNILEFYLIGVAVYLLFIIWFNYQFDHNKNLKNVTLSEWLKDISFCPFSWLVVALGVVITVWRFKGGKPVE